MLKTGSPICSGLRGFEDGTAGIPRILEAAESVEVVDDV